MTDISETESLTELRADLAAEVAALDAVLDCLRDEDWSRDSPSPGWTVADQVGHLAFFDDTAALSVRNPLAFEVHREQHLAALPDDVDDALTLAAYRAMEPGQVLAVWRAHAAELAVALTELEPARRLAWYGPPMGARSFLTARLMETWAHGQDVVDALVAAGRPVDRPPGDGLRHVAHLGHLTRDWSYANRGLEAPGVPVSVRLVAPSGETWSYGDEAAEQSVHGPAEDFCLVVTQRRHLDDTELDVRGDAAREWLLLAQAFAGPPTDGPAAGLRPLRSAAGRRR